MICVSWYFEFLPKLCYCFSVYCSISVYVGMGFKLTCIFAILVTFVTLQCVEAGWGDWGGEGKQIDSNKIKLLSFAKRIRDHWQVHWFRRTSQLLHDMLRSLALYYVKLTSAKFFWNQWIWLVLNYPFVQGEATELSNIDILKIYSRSKLPDGWTVQYGRWYSLFKVPVWWLSWR